MKLYNYRIVYDNGQETELLKCENRLVISDTKWIEIKTLNENRCITINMNKVVFIELWITKE